MLPAMASAPQSRGRELVARAYHAAIGYHRYMAVWGGSGGGGVHIETSVVECFDVLSATWVEARQLSQYLPDGLRYMAVACDEERAYTFGGLSTESRRINDVYEVDLTSLVCSKVEPSPHSAPSPSARQFSAIVISRRRLVNYGGDTSGFGAASDELHVLDLDASE